MRSAAGFEVEIGVEGRGICDGVMGLGISDVVAAAAVVFVSILWMVDADGDGDLEWEF